MGSNSEFLLNRHLVFSVSPFSLNTVKEKLRDAVQISEVVCSASPFPNSGEISNSKAKFCFGAIFSNLQYLYFTISKFAKSRFGQNLL
jgi:hypothetical protein